MSFKQIRQRLNEIRQLRNRISHYEAIWDRPDLLQDYLNILDAIGWISQPLRDAIETLRDFEYVYDSGVGVRRVREMLEHKFGAI